MTNDQVAAQIKEAGWGSKSQILTRHLASLIQLGTWPGGSKVPPTRQIAKDYGVSLETVRSAMRELQGRGLIRIKARSGAVVCEAAPSGRGTTGTGIVAYVRLLDRATTSREPHVPGDVILASMEQQLLEKPLHLVLVSERPDTDNRGQVLAERLEQLQSQLAGAVLLRPPTDVRLAVTRLLDDLQTPWVTIGRSSSRETGNVVPDYLRMGHLIGRYLAAIQARHVLFVTLPLTASERLSGVEKMQGVVGGYLQLHQPSPIITPLICQTTGLEDSYQATRDYLKHNPLPDAVVGHGDRMTLGAIQAIREAGFRVPEDVVALGTTGARQADLPDAGLSGADQMEHQLACTTIDLLLEMIATGKRHTGMLITPVRLVFRQSTRMTEPIRQLLADEIASGEVIIED